MPPHLPKGFAYPAQLAAQQENSATAGKQGREAARLTYLRRKAAAAPPDKAELRKLADEAARTHPISRV
jgi:hypothetical protein